MKNKRRFKQKLSWIIVASVSVCSLIMVYLYKVDPMAKLDKAYSSAASKQEKNSKKVNFRTEKDSLGPVQVPAHALYGAQTVRAQQNFEGLTTRTLSEFPAFIQAYALIKIASAKANHELGHLDKKKADAIIKASEKLINDSSLYQHFPINMLQGGAGTSTNMNVNEVIANLAQSELGVGPAQYHVIHPNNHVNKSQSTNDTYPSAIKLAVLKSLPPLLKSLEYLEGHLNNKAKEFKNIVKMGRTQLQDAVAMSLGDEFSGYASRVRDTIEDLKVQTRFLKSLNLGGTAIGNKVNAPPGYSVAVINQLNLLTGQNFKLSRNFFKDTPNAITFTGFADALKRTALHINEISNNLRLLSSGPKTGMSDINLPKTQPGSSIMPGKVNPVIPEAYNQIAYTVIGNVTTIDWAASQGQLQLNAMEPIIALKLFESMKLLEKGHYMLANLAIKGTSANPKHTREQVMKSAGTATLLVPFIGYDKGSYIVKKALKEHRRVDEVAKEEGVPAHIIEKVFSDKLMLNPQNIFQEVQKNNKGE